MILEACRSLLTVALIVEAGVILTLLIRRGRPGSPAELAGIAISLGMGGVATGLFWFSLAGLRPSPGLQMLLATVLLVPLVWLVRRDARSSLIAVPACPLPVGLRIARYACMALVLLTLTAIGAESLLSPITAWDAMAIWATKARVLAVSSLAAKPPWFYDPAFSYSHMDYPLLIPMTMAAIYSAVHGFFDQAAKLTFVMIFLGMALMLYGGLSRLTSRLASIALVAALLCAPLMMRWAGTGYADIGVTLYAGGAALCYTLFIRDGERSDMLVGLLMCLFMAFTKNEGMAIAIAMTLLAIAFSLSPALRSKAVWFLLAAAGGALVLLPFILWARQIPKTHEDYGGRLSDFMKMAQISRLPYVLKGIALELLDVSHWGLLWYLPLVAVLAGFRRLRRPEVAFVILAMLAQFGSYVAAYMVSPYTPQRLIPGTLDRLVLQAAPLAVIAVAAIYGTPAPSSDGASPATPTQNAPITR